VKTVVWTELVDYRWGIQWSRQRRKQNKLPWGGGAIVEGPVHGNSFAASLAAWESG